jgi:transcriptional antiterminator RfaH
VSFGSEPAKVIDGLIAYLRGYETPIQGAPVHLFKPGEWARLTEGAFAGIDGIYQIAEGERRVMVLIELMSKPVTMHVSPAGLRKVGLAARKSSLIHRATQASV